MESNILTIIKKIRPKIKIGDCFCFNINNAFYTGVVLHNQLIEKYGNNTMFSIVVLNYHEKSIEALSLSKLEESLKQRDLLIAPININKLGWTRGFLHMIGNINSANFAQDIMMKYRYMYSMSSIYDMNYEETSEIDDLKLIGRTGIYNHLGLESLVQISLDLEFSIENHEEYNPYGYYDDLKEVYPRLELPFWYHKAKLRLNNPPPDIFH